MSRNIVLAFTSRMQKTKLIHVEDDYGNYTNVYHWGTWQRIDLAGITVEKLHRVSQGDVGRLDYLSYRYFNTSELWWVIADANDIEDPMDDSIIGTQLKILNYDELMTKLTGV